LPPGYNFSSYLTSRKSLFESLEKPAADDSLDTKPSAPAEDWSSTPLDRKPQTVDAAIDADLVPMAYGPERNTPNIEAHHLDEELARVKHEHAAECESLRHEHEAQQQTLKEQFDHALQTIARLEADQRARAIEAAIEKSSLEEQLRLTKENNQQLESNVAQLERLNQNFQVKYDELQTELNRQQAAFSEKLEEIQQLKNDSLAKKADCTVLQDGLAAKDHRCVELQEQLEETQAEMEALQEEDEVEHEGSKRTISDLREENLRLQAALKEEKAQHATLMRNLDCRTFEEELLSENVALRISNSELESLYTALKKESETWRQQLANGACIPQPPSPSPEATKSYRCSIIGCEKVYKYRKGLWSHKKVRLIVSKITELR
jgi:hypothetical protein